MSSFSLRAVTGSTATPLKRAACLASLVASAFCSAPALASSHWVSEVMKLARTHDERAAYSLMVASWLSAWSTKALASAAVGGPPCASAGPPTRSTAARGGGQEKRFHAGVLNSFERARRRGSGAMGASARRRVKGADGPGPPRLLQLGEVFRAATVTPRSLIRPVASE